MRRLSPVLCPLVIAIGVLATPARADDDTTCHNASGDGGDHRLQRARSPPADTAASELAKLLHQPRRRAQAQGRSSTPPSPTTTRRDRAQSQRSIRLQQPRQRTGGTRATSTAPSPTTPPRSGSIPTTRPPAPDRGLVYERKQDYPHARADFKAALGSRSAANTPTPAGRPAHRPRAAGGAREVARAEVARQTHRAHADRRAASGGHASCCPPCKASCPPCESTETAAPASARRSRPEPEHQVGVLDRLARRALGQVVERGEDHHPPGPRSAITPRCKVRPAHVPRRRRLAERQHPHERLVA